MDDHFINMARLVWNSHAEVSKLDERCRKQEAIIVDCQRILAEHLPPDGPDAKETISRLLAILDGPRAREALRE